MATYIILNKLSPDAMKQPGEFKGLAETLSSKKCRRH